MATHLSADEREFIAVHLEAGRSVAWISRTIGRPRCTFYRERRRNGLGKHYSAHVAQQRAQRRRAEGRVKCRKMRQAEVREFVIKHLKLHWSPEQIAGALKRQFPQDKRWHLTA